MELPTNIFKCVVGSTVYGTHNENSDIDYKAVHVAPKVEIYTGTAKEQIITNKDDLSYELNKFVNLIKVSNPSCLEMLYTPEKHIIECHPLFKELFINARHAFLSKTCKDTFGGYVKSQIMKASALDKKMNWEMSRVERKGVLDFCHTFYENGSTKFNKILTDNNLKQRYCGLSKVPNMHDMYNVYYDLGNHMLHEVTLPSDEFLIRFFKLPHGVYDMPDLINSIKTADADYMEVFYNSLDPHTYGMGKAITLKTSTLTQLITPIGFRGIVSENTDEESNEVRLSSIPKFCEHVYSISWNKTGYTVHCKDYREYNKWLKERNTQRYVDTSAHGQMIDGKNLLHCVRLLSVCKEIATEGKIILERPNAEYLKDIRKGKYNLAEIIEKAKEDLQNLDSIYEKSDLPETINIEFINSLSYIMREEIYDR
ncbi:MAG: DNA polymerase beta superfamily protein [Bacteroidales bacterium]